MTNQSIKNAFDRFWQHVIAKLGDKADINHSHSWNDLDDKPFGETEDGAIETLDPKYLPEADCDWNLMKNKPFYENITTKLMFEVEVVLSRIQQFEGDYYSGTTSTTFYLEDSPYYSYFKANKTYRVTIGDRVELFTQRNNAPTIKTDINSSGVFDSTCVGFFIARTGGQLLEVRLDSTYGNGESEITKHIIVEEVEIELKTLDPKYLPNTYINELIDTKLEVIENGSY